MARAEAIAVDLAKVIDDSPGIASTIRYSCSADAALQVAETNLAAPAAQAPRDTVVEMVSLLETEAFETTLVDGEAGTGDVILRASDFELTVDVHFSTEATTITVTTDCLRSG
ncbi:MAG: hypothetical protein WEE36_10185 [Acidimicrobiia bacterium]